MKTKEILPELFEVERLIHEYQGILHPEKLGEVSNGKYSFPIYGLSLGSTDPKAPPCLVFLGECMDWRGSEPMFFSHF